MEKFTNLETGEIYELPANTMLHSATGIFDVKKSREFSGGVIGAAIPLSSVMGQKSFTLQFISGDPTGYEQMRINRFFSASDGFYRIEAPWLKGNVVDFSVVEIDVGAFGGSSFVDVTCMAKFGDFVDENRITIHEYTAPTSTTATWSGVSTAFTNTTEFPVEIVVELSTAGIVTWRNSTTMMIRKGTATTAPRMVSISGKYDAAGNLTTWTGNRYSASSWTGIEEGNGVVFPGQTEFWRVMPGETVTVVVPAITRPINGNSPFTAKVFAKSLRQKASF